MVCMLLEDTTTTQIDIPVKSRQLSLTRLVGLLLGTYVIHSCDWNEGVVLSKTEKLTT